MTKPKSPLLSLGARGTIGDALTFQKRGQATIVRAKPIPKDPYSLNQAYQRWDYRDYAYLWTLLSESEKQVYRTKASRYHITGFSQWMREKLKYLPSIIGRWRLDEKSGAIAYDSSKQDNNGIIYGASPATGIIDDCFSFDGLNDRVEIGSHASLNPENAISVDTWLNLITFANMGGLISRNPGFDIRLTPTNALIFLLNIDSGWRNLGASSPLTFGEWAHLAFTYDSTTRQGKVYKNGALDVTITLSGLAAYTMEQGVGTAHIGYDVLNGIFINARIDHLILYNRTLDQTEIKRHSERRYP